MNRSGAELALPRRLRHFLSSVSQDGPPKITGEEWGAPIGEEAAPLFSWRRLVSYSYVHVRRSSCAAFLRRFDRQSTDYPLTDKR